MARAIDDYNDGKSFYKIAYRLKVSPKTVYNWFQKLPGRLFKSMQEKILKVNSFSSTRHVDGTELKIRKKKNDVVDQKVHMWAMIDNKTKFVNCFHLSEKKDAEACEDFLKKSSNQQRPGYIVSDNAFTFREPIDNVFNKGHSNWKKPKVKHVAITKSDPKYKEFKGFNNLIERLFQTLKSRTKVARGYEKISSLQNLMFMFFLNYNFTKPHKTIGMTPADAAGIGLGLKRPSFYHLMEMLDIR